MSIKEISTEKWDVNLLGDDFSGLNDVYREIADEIGFEKTVVIFNLFHGTQVSFPNRLFSREYTHRAILKEYNGKMCFNSHRNTIIQNEQYGAY